MILFSKEDEGQMYEKLKTKNRALVVAVLNCTNSPIEMTHCQLITGKLVNETIKSIKPKHYSNFFFKNTYLQGISGELFFDHPKNYFRVAFSNPLVGICKGLTDCRATKFSKEEQEEGFLNDKMDDNNPQDNEHFQTKYFPNNPIPIYIIVIKK